MRPPPAAACPLCTLMLFLNWYPGVDDPFLSSSLKMTICSKRKTRRSLERDRTPASCSVTKKVSCCSSLPWHVSLPCRHMGLVDTIHLVRTGHFLEPVIAGGGCAGMHRKCTYLVSLQPTQVHHVITQFRDLRHQIYSFLQEPERRWYPEVPYTDPTCHPYIMVS